MEERLLLAPSRLGAWTWALMALALALAYLVTLENGAVLRSGAALVHELFHDGRHFLGVPCH